MRYWLIAALCAGSIAGCGPSTSGGDLGGSADAAPNDPCSGETTRCAGDTYQTCVDGAFQDVTTCSSQCVPGVGCAACDPSFGRTCVGDSVHGCNDDGSLGELIETCGLESCDAGRCVDDCGDAAASNSYIGCEYWAVDLHNATDVVGEPLLGGCSLYGVPTIRLETVPVCYNPSPANPLTDPTIAGLCDPGNDCAAAPAGFTCQSRSVCLLDAEESPFAVVVSNPHPSKAARVTIENAVGRTSEVDVAGGAVVQIFPQSLGFTDQSVRSGGVGAHAYRLTATRPIVAYQFNPLDNVGVFSNDGSLLLPVHTLDTDYYAITLPSLARRPTAHDFSGYLSVVATASGTTDVDVTPTAAVRAGNGTPAIAAGVTHSFSLQQYDVLTLEASGAGDLTGTRVQSATAPFAVFAGHVATGASAQSGACCADHLEDQLFGAGTWGKRYAVARSQARGNEPDRVRILAQRADTHVTLTPAMGTCPVLGPGEHCQLDITGDVEISADQPISVAHFLLAVGQSGSGVNPQGDPAMAMAVPTEQFRTDYTLLVPQQYATNFFAVVAPAAGTVHLDGADITGQLVGFGSGEFKAGRVTVTAGQHTLSCPAGCGVEIGGYDEAVSYLFAGGLDLERIVVD